MGMRWIYIYIYYNYIYIHRYMIYIFWVNDNILQTWNLHKLAASYGNNSPNHPPSSSQWGCDFLGRNMLQHHLPSQILWYLRWFQFQDDVPSGNLLHSELENHHSQWVNPRTKCTIFNSYFDITRGYLSKKIGVLGVDHPTILRSILKGPTMERDLCVANKKSLNGHEIIEIIWDDDELIKSD